MDTVELLKHPPYLALATFLTGIVIIGLGTLMSNFAPLPENTVFVWGIFVSMMLIYTIFNTVFFFALKNKPGYWPISIYSFIGLSVLSILTAWLFTGSSLYQVDGFRSILSILVIGYSVFIGIGWSINRIVLLSIQRDEEKLNRDSDEIGHKLH
jgi:magnesium-transporting ATPase (P-type)